MSATTVYDLALAGHYTKDTLVYPHSTRTVDGGACFFGANIRLNGIACSVEMMRVIHIHCIQE